MRILLVHKFFKLTGGADFFFFEVARVLEQNGHEIAFFATKDTANQATEYEPYFIEPPDFKSGSLVKRIFSIKNIVYSKSAKENFSELVNHFKPDLVHVFAIATHISPSIFEITKEKKIPVVASLNDYKHICPNYKLYHHGRICEDCKNNNYFHAIKNKCAHNSLIYSTASAIESYFHNKWKSYSDNIDLFLFASKFMANKTEEFWIDRDFKWQQVLNPFNPNEYSPSYNHQEYGVYFGRIIEEKGVDFLIYALEKTKVKKFLIIGEGPQEIELRNYVREKKINNIEFLGPKWGNELNSLVKKAKYVVVPSIWHENFPYVIIQAFAMGKPVIGSNRGGIPELVINNKTGLVFNPDNIGSLVDALNKMEGYTKEIIEMGENARRYVETSFGDKIFYDSILHAYNSVIKGTI